MRPRRWLWALLLSTGAAAVDAQVLVPDWRRIGNTAVEASLAAEAGGPVAQVWFSPEGERLFARTGSGNVLVTEDFDSWRQAESPVEPPVRLSPASLLRLPEAGARLVAAGRTPGLVYAAGQAVYRSEDGGRSWTNLTDYRGASILGGGFTDLAVSPRNDDEIVAANRYGLWRSLDGGLSWSGLNRSLPNLPVRRIIRLPTGAQGLRVLLDNVGAAEWAPGEQVGWRPVMDATSAAEEALKQAVGAVVGAELLAVATAADAIYAGGVEGGRLWASLDRGRTWRPFTAPDGGPIRDIWVSAENPRVALAAGGDAGSGVHILKTTNGGIFWDDITGELPDVRFHAVTADLESGFIYAAGDRGIYFGVADLRGAGRETSWSVLGGRLAGRAAFDVALDPGGHQLYAAIDGEGVFSAIAPHRFFHPKVVHSADLAGRPASPGALLSVVGRQVLSGRAGSWDVPVLAATPIESQIQVPFEVSGSGLRLALATAGRAGELERMSVDVALRQATPGILVDRDGTPMVLDAASGVLLNAMTPARAGGRIQILATGLGKVRPEWPSGLPAPLEDPPQVVTEVRVYLDRRPLPVTRATLAPGYIGFYLVEALLPELVNAGAAELILEAGGELSNPVRIYLEP